MSIDRVKMRKMALDASEKSYSPYSKAKVGCSLLMEDGSYTTGSNIENSSFGGTICAERVAIFTAIHRGISKIKAIYIYTKDGWPPCGLCRQVMSEFASDDSLIIMGDANNKEKEYTFKELLPEAFTPEHLIK